MHEWTRESTPDPLLCFPSGHNLSRSDLGQLPLPAQILFFLRGKAQPNLPSLEHLLKSPWNSPCSLPVPCCPLCLHLKTYHYLPTMTLGVATWGIAFSPAIFVSFWEAVTVYFAGVSPLPHPYGRLTSPLPPPLLQTGTPQYFSSKDMHFPHLLFSCNCSWNFITYRCC